MSEISQTTTEKSETNEDNLVDKKTKKPKLI